MWEIVGWVISSSARRKVLETVDDKPKTPKTISETADLRLPYVSRSLSELSEEGLVTCLNPEAHKGRLYRITDKGKKALNKIEKEDL